MATELVGFSSMGMLAAAGLFTSAAAAPYVVALASGRVLPDRRVLQGKRRDLWCRRALAPADDEEAEMSDMSNVGLDDVFNLIQQATDADPEPEDLIPSDTRRDMKSTGASQWYKVYGRSVPPSVDARAAYYGPKRPLWKGGATSPKDVPAYLKGEYPGDYGCDVLGLCKDPAKFATLRAQELFNGRWAMLGIVGCIVPELISPSNPSAFEPVWFKAGAQIFSDAGIDYLGLPGLINAHNIYAVAAVQLVLMGGAELARSKAAPKDIDSLYPGGKTFDPLGFSSDAESFADLKVKEIKNGRLAMLAMAGLFAQGAVTGVGPIQNLHDFLHL